MTSTSEAKGIVNNDEPCHFENIITGGQFAGNPLFPEFTRLYEEYKKIARKADDMTKENQRIKIQLVEMSRSLDLTTRIDVMTGLANRRDILGKIEQEFSRAHRHQRTFSVILADIDGFKRINDNYGFNAGDELLVEIANVLRGSVRSEDICARWGGEEFLFLLPETGIEGAESVAQKIHQSVSMTEFRVNKPGIRVTISLGVSEYNQGQTTFECIANVERALQMAKQSGKNRYCVAPQQA
jgi:diguanylate cyclase